MKGNSVIPNIQDFLLGKPDYTLALFDHFITTFRILGDIQLHATKSMIAIGAPEKRIAWVTQLGKNFIHVVFPFHEVHSNDCFIKVGLVPGSNTQYNHHFRMLYKEDVNSEVLGFMQLALRFETPS